MEGSSREVVGVTFLLLFVGIKIGIRIDFRMVHS